MQLLACSSSQSVVPIACCLLAILCCVFPSSSNNDCLPDQQQSVCWFSRQEFTTRCNCEHQVFCTFSAPVCGKLCSLVASLPSGLLLQQPFIVGPSFSPILAKTDSKIVTGKYVDLWDLFSVNSVQTEPPHHRPPRKAEDFDDSFLRLLFSLPL